MFNIKKSFDLLKGQVYFRKKFNFKKVEFNF